MDLSWRRWALRVGAAALIAVVAAAWPYRLIGGSASDEVDRLAGELDRTRRAAAVQRRHIAELRREIDALADEPTAIEEFARRELGMVRPGEVVLRFESGKPPAPAKGVE